MVDIVDIVPLIEERDKLHSKFWEVWNKLAAKAVIDRDISPEDFRELEAEIAVLEAEVESLLARLEGRR